MSVVFKKSAARPQQRTRLADDDNDDNDDDKNENKQSPITLASKLKAKSKKSQTKSRLSFGADDEAGEDTPFQLKKSSLSRKIALGTHPASLPATLDQATISVPSNGAPVYDQAYLSELKARTPSTRPLVKDDAYDMDVSVSAEQSAMDIISPAESTDTVIPSQSRILAAKERRERLRVSGAEQDYISLSVTKRTDVSQGPHPESRLMREEDELGEGDDEYAEYTSAQERIALGKKARKVEASKLRDTMQEMIADVVEEDEETLEWEREQLRRGGHDSATAARTDPVKQIYKAAPIPPPTDIPTLGPAIERFQRSLASLSNSHASNTAAATSLADERNELDARETELREMITAAESKRSWFADFRDWIESVATFLDEKFPRLEKLEGEHLAVIKERAEMIARRRDADNTDDLSAVFGILPQSTPQSRDVDELGRTIPSSNSSAMRKERRTSRLARRARRHRMRVPPNADDREEGYSTDSSLPPSDALDYESALERIATDGKDILSDVRAIEFKEPSRGLAKRFGEWRERYADTYTGAWGGLGLVGTWEFWVRLEILAWNPFESQKSLSEFSWYLSLHQYCRPQGGNEENDDPELGPDGDLISAMTSTAVVPHICKMIEAGALDPYSAKGVHRMIDLAEQVEASIGTDSNKFQMILKSVHSVFDSAAANAEVLLTPFIQLNRLPFNPDAIPARQRLLNRASKLVENMLRWRKYAGDKLTIGELCTRHVNNFMFPIADSGWEVGGEQKVRQAITMLPPDLAGSVKATMRT